MPKAEEFQQLAQRGRREGGPGPGKRYAVKGKDAWVPEGSASAPILTPKLTGPFTARVAQFFSNTFV